MRRVSVRLATSRRVQLAVVTNALISISSLLLAISIARRSSVDEFATFAVAMTLYVMANGIIRAAITETTLAIEPSRSNDEIGFQRASLVSLVAGGAMVLLGWFLGSWYLAVVGVCFNGLTSLDYSRTVNAALHRSGVALAQGVAWSVTVICVSGVSLVLPLRGTTLFAVWAGAGAIIGYLSTAEAGYPWAPRWLRNPRQDKAAAWFSVDYLAGSGGSLLSTNLLVVVLNTTAVGAVRGAGTILGPVGLVSTTARSLSIVYLSRARAVGGRHEFRSAVAAAGALAVVVGPLAVAITLIPDRVGRELLGRTWDSVSPILLALAIESVLALVGSIAAAGHRSRLAGARTLTLRLLVGIPRPMIVVLAAWWFGIEGAAWSMAAIAAVNVVLWWFSYWRLTCAESQSEPGNV